MAENRPLRRLLAELDNIDPGSSQPVRESKGPTGLDHPEEETEMDDSIRTSDLSRLLPPDSEQGLTPQTTGAEYLDDDISVGISEDLSTMAMTEDLFANISVRSQDVGRSIPVLHANEAVRTAEGRRKQIQLMGVVRALRQRLQHLLDTKTQLENDKSMLLTAIDDTLTAMCQKQIGICSALIDRIGHRLQDINDSIASGTDDIHESKLAELIDLDTLVVPSLGFDASEVANAILGSQESTPSQKRIKELEAELARERELRGRETSRLQTEVQDQKKHYKSLQQEYENVKSFAEKESGATMEVLTRLEHDIKELENKVIDREEEIDRLREERGESVEEHRSNLVAVRQDFEKEKTALRKQINDLQKDLAQKSIDHEESVRALLERNELIEKLETDMQTRRRIITFEMPKAKMLPMVDSELHLETCSAATEEDFGIIWNVLLDAMHQWYQAHSKAFNKTLYEMRRRQQRELDGLMRQHEITVKALRESYEKQIALMKLEAADLEFHAQAATTIVADNTVEY
eukprot:Clim_evm95s88 gene=Clim_evmTU95s88